MRFVKIDPPGTLCQLYAIEEMINKTGAHTFVEVGCGEGGLSHLLCSRGLTGVGVDFSDEALRLARDRMGSFISDGRYKVVKGDALELGESTEKFDVALSIMVMEHVQDDKLFLRKIQGMVKPNGFLLIGVPGRRDRWGVEDETVGHLRRYDREDLSALFDSLGFRKVTIWSVAVPTANLLFHLGNFFVRHSQEVKKKDLSVRSQTETSGIREVPFKTVFPEFFRWFLNDKTLYPLLIIQRLFYKTGLGLTLLALAQNFQSPDSAGDGR